MCVCVCVREKERESLSSCMFSVAYYIVICDLSGSTTALSYKRHDFLKKVIGHQSFFLTL